MKEDADVMMFWPMICNISIAGKTKEFTDLYEGMIERGEAMTVIQKRHLKLLYLTRPRLIAAGLESGLEDMLLEKKSDPNLPFIPCCCCWAC